MVCIERNGFHGTTTDDIARQAGLSAGAMYRYFDSKDAVIEALAMERHAEERALLDDALAEEDPATAIRSFVEWYFDWLADPDEQRRRRVNVHVWAEALGNPRLAAVVTAGIAPLHDAARAVEDAVRSGSLPPTIDAEAFVRVVLALLQGFILQQAWDSTFDANRYRATVLTLLDGMLAPAGPGSDREPAQRADQAASTSSGRSETASPSSDSFNRWAQTE